MRGFESPSGLQNMNGINLFKFFDTFGLIVFSFLLIDALIDIKTSSERNWRMYARLIIGVAGLLVDGFLVFFY